MADIDNMRGDTLRVVEENTLDNMRGVTQRVISENSIDNTRGVTYRVYNVNPASAPVIDELNVTPSTSAQTITVPEGTDGYSPVNVSAVTSAIDANIVAGNIKKDVQILGVTGSYEGAAPSGPSIPLGVTAGALHLDTPIDLSGVSTFNLDIFSKSSSSEISDFNKATGPAFINADVLTSISVDCRFMFNNCTGLTDVSLPSLTTATTNYACLSMFAGCTGITTVDLGSLTTIGGNSMMRQMFSRCSSLASISLDKLTSITAENGFRNCFNQCSALTTISLYSLKTITGATSCNYLFEDCTSLSDVYFSSLKSTSFGSNIDQFISLVANVTGCTIHFPKNLDPQGGSTVISSLTGYPLFSGTNTVLAFDLPSTVILTGANSQAYERNPKDDTGSALAWRKQDTGTLYNPIIDWTSFYTSTTNDPTVGGTIYSDAACTQAVTTISSIA